jgi:hypothetical protein
MLVLGQRIFRMDLYSRFDAYVISALAVSAFIQLGWSAFAALAIHDAVVGTSVWVVVVVYAVGVISSYVASVAVGALYMGALYRMVNAVLAILSFILFSLWPTAGATIYGWFFDLF